MKQIIFRLDDYIFEEFDKKLKDRNLSKQFFLSYCVDLLIKDNILITDQGNVTNDFAITDIRLDIKQLRDRITGLEAVVYRDLGGY
jgi:hypothetical protein